MILAALTALMFGAASQAHDLLPPPWRGTPLGVEGHWTPAGGWNVQIYPSTPPTGTIWPVPPSGPNPITGAGPNTWQVDFPNWIDEQPLKIGRIQIYWDQPLTDFPPPQIDIMGFKNNNPLPTGSVITGSVPISGSGGTIGWYWDFTIQPNPDWETFIFDLPSTLPPTQIDIDTASIPEPASLTLIALGGIALLRRRR